MHILVTNDDGIDSPGLWDLAWALQSTGLGSVTVIAPDEEQSGTSMGLPPKRSHRIRAVRAPDPAHTDLNAFAYNGTPVGCLTVGMRAGLCPRPDAVVSGINRGLNSGDNVLLSGTVGAAMIALQWGVPSLAVSLQFMGDAPMPWGTASWAAVQVFPLLVRLAEHGPLALNLNVPHIHTIADLRGFRQTSLSGFFYGDYLDIDAGPADESGERDLRFTFVRERIPAFPETSDEGAIRAGYVSVTPLAPLVGQPDLDLSAELARIEL